MSTEARPMEAGSRTLPQLPEFSMAPVWKAFGEAHKAVYLGSGGRLGSRLAWIPMLLLSTRGRRTGLVRTMPLTYLPDPIEEDSFVVVGSNGGSEQPPASWLNLQATEIATAQVGRKSFWVRAEIVPPSRRPSLWVDLRRKLPPVLRRISRTAASLVCFFCFAITRNSSGSFGPRDMSLSFGRGGVLILLTGYSHRKGFGRVLLVIPRKDRETNWKTLEHYHRLIRPFR